MGKKLILEARVNEYATRTANPNVPFSIEEIVETAVAARKAGAAILHYHARTPEGSADTSLAANAEVIRSVRAETDILVLPTLGFIANDSDARSRIDVVAALSRDPGLRPDIVPIDTGSANLETWNEQAKSFGERDRLYVNTTDSLIHYARTLREGGVKPKLVSWSVGFTRRALAMVAAGYVDEPIYMLFHLTDGHIITGHPPTEAGLRAHLAFLPEDQAVEWSVNCLGGSLLEIAPIVFREGGHMAIGIGDYPYLELGMPTNADVISRVVEVAQKEGREPATPQDVRIMLGLSPTELAG